MRKLIAYAFMLVATFMVAGCLSGAEGGPGDGRYADHDGGRANFRGGG